MSLNVRRCHQSSNTTRWVIDPLSSVAKWKGSPPTVWATAAPITPPWAKAAMRPSGWFSCRRCKALDTRPGERFVALGSGNRIPAAGLEHLPSGRMAVSDMLAERSALPLAQVHLPKIRLDRGLETGDLHQRGGSLVGALE